MAETLGLAEGCGDDRDAKVACLVRAIKALKQELGIPRLLREAGVPEEAFLEKLDVLSEQAFDDQRTTGNPRYPLIAEIKELYTRAYYGELLRSVL